MNRRLADSRDWRAWTHPRLFSLITGSREAEAHPLPPVMEGSAVTLVARRDLASRCSDGTIVSHTVYELWYVGPNGLMDCQRDWAAHPNPHAHAPVSSSHLTPNEFCDEIDRKRNKAANELIAETKAQFRKAYPMGKLPEFKSFTYLMGEPQLPPKVNDRLLKWLEHGALVRPQVKQIVKIRKAPKLEQEP